VLNTNLVVLAGNLTRDPELRYTPGGAAVCTLGIANNETWRDKNDQLQKRTTFVDIVCWERTAENVAKFLKKGAPVLVEGSLQLDQWEDKNGDKRSTLKIRANRVQFVAPPDHEPGDAPPPAAASDGRRLF
jgi:single-strand DNA-binding protein